MLARDSVVGVGSTDLAPGHVAHARFYALIDSMLERPSTTQQDVADRLGVTQAQVSNWVRRKHDVGLNSVSSAIAALHIRPEYFFDATLVDPRWEDFVDRSRAAPFDWSRFVSNSDPSGWQQFAQRYLERFVREGLSEPQIEQLRAMAFRGGPPPGPGQYIDMAEILMRDTEGMVPPGAAKAAAEQAESGGEVSLRPKRIGGGEAHNPKVTPVGPRKRPRHDRP